MNFITKEESENLRNRMQQLAFQYAKIAEVEASEIIKNVILGLNENSEAGNFITVLKCNILMGILDEIFQDANKHGKFILPFESAKIIEILVHEDI